MVFILYHGTSQEQALQFILHNASKAVKKVADFLVNRKTTKHVNMITRTNTVQL